MTTNLFKNRQQSMVVVPCGQMLDFEKRLHALNVKAERFGLLPIVAGEPRIARFLVTTEIDNKDGEWKTRSLRRLRDGEKTSPNAEIVRSFEIDLDYPIVKLGDWTVIAQVESMGDANLIFTVSRSESDALIAEKYRTCPLECDHCNTNRQRKLSYILKDSTGDEIKQVGSSCLEDFTGVDPAAALFIAKMQEFIRLADCSDERDGRMGRASSLSTRDYLTRVIFLTEKNGFISSAKARDEGVQATYDVAVRMETLLENSLQLKRDYYNVYDRNAEVADKIINWYTEKVSVDSFDSNVKMLLASDDILIDRKHLAFAAASVPTYHRHIQNKMRDQLPKADLHHVGIVGKKISSLLEVEKVHSYETAYGMQFRVNLRDVEGNKLSWKTATPPNELLEAKNRIFNADFKIKEHGDYNGIPQTEVSHLKFKGWLKKELAVITIFDVNTAAFNDIGKKEELARIFSDAGKTVDKGWDGITIILNDTNGNAVGQIEGADQEQESDAWIGEIRVVVYADAHLAEYMKSTAAMMKECDIGFAPLHDTNGRIIGSLCVRDGVALPELDTSVSNHEMVV